MSKISYEKNVEFIIGEFNYIERLSEICLKNDKLPIRLCSIQSFDLKQYENILLIIEQILYFQEQYIKKEYVINKLDIFLLPNFESYTREIERNNQSVFMSTGTLGLFIFNKEKLDSIINHQNDYTALMNNPTFIFSISQEIAKTWIRNLISPYDLTEYWFFEALATNIAFLSLKESKMNFDFDLEYEFYNHYTKYALDSFKLFSPPRKEFDAYLKNTIDESQIYTGISIIKMFLDMYTIYNNIEYFYDEDEDEGEDMEVDYEEEEEEEEFDEEMELYDIKDTLREFIQRYKNRAVREGEFFRCFINHIGKYTMANIFEFWISKARGYPVVKVMKEEYNIKKNKLTLHLKQFPGFYPKEEEYEFYEYQSQYSREPRRIPIFIRLYEYDLQTGDLIKEFSYIELLYRFDQIINIPVVKKDSKRETGFFYIISEKASSFYRVIYPMESLNNILNHQNLLTSIDKYRIWDDYQLYMDYFVKKNKELKTTHEESETDILNQQLMIIQAFSKSYDTTITLEMMNTLNKILRVYSIYENGSHNLFLEKYKAFRNDTFNNIYEQVKDKIGENSMNSSILIECLKINDERILDKVKNEIISKTKNKDLIPYKTWLRINAYTSTNNEDIERDYINNFINENKSQIDDFHLNLIIEKIVMKFSVNNIMSMLVQLLDKLVIGKNQGNTEELNNCIYIIKRSLIQLSERVVEPPEILQIHNNLMNWLMENFKSLVINLGYSMNLALIINATLTNLYGDNDLEKIETFFVDFLANETKQETEEVDFISYWIIEKILKKNKNVNELVKNVFEILEPSFK